MVLMKVVDIQPGSTAYDSGWRYAFEGSSSPHTALAVDDWCAERFGPKSRMAGQSVFPDGCAWCRWPQSFTTALWMFVSADAAFEFRMRWC